MRRRAEPTAAPARRRSRPPEDTEPTRRTRRRREPDNALWRFVESPTFTTAVVAVILGNALILGLQTYPGLVREYGGLLDLLNSVCLGFFVVELALRIGAYGRRPQDFFRSGWNIFDFVVIVAAFVPGLRANSTLLRLARLARIVRVVRLLPDVRVLLTAVFRSLPPLGSMVTLTTLILFVYGMIGWLLFAEEDPENWGNIGEAMLTLFVLLTLESFPAMLERGMEIHPWSWVYFVSFVLVAAFIVLNVLIGIVLHSMEEARELERRRRIGVGDTAEIAPAPIAERIVMLRAALKELEDELAAAMPRDDDRP
jgi:voltage-gated sodium channel